jgi:hypothetical protein
MKINLSVTNPAAAGIVIRLLRAPGGAARRPRGGDTRSTWVPDLTIPLSDRPSFVFNHRSRFARYEDS